MTTTQTADLFNLTNARNEARNVGNGATVRKLSFGTEHGYVVFGPLVERTPGRFDRLVYLNEHGADWASLLGL